MSAASDEVRLRLQADLGRVAAEHEVPGVSAAVLVEDDVIEAASGVINLRTGETVTPGTLFMIQSVTKTITATLVLQLVDDGLLGLDDPVRDHLPGFRTAEPAASDKITVRHLLTHTGGFEGDLWAPTTSEDDALQHFVEDLVAQAAQHSAPGQRFSYCNAGYGTLGRLVEVQRGMPYERALRRHLAQPLRMDEIAFSADQALAFRTAIGHTRPEAGAPQRPLLHWAELPPSNPAAGNQLAMSARALLAFARMHLAGGRADDGGTVLSAASVQEMQKPQVRHPGIHGPHSSHGLGWWLERGELVEHGGGSTGVTSALRMAPRHGVAAVVLTNGGAGGALIEELLEQLFGDLPGVAPEVQIALPEEIRVVSDPRPFLGRFESRVAGFDVTCDDTGRLWRQRTPRHEVLTMAERAGTTIGTQTERHELRLLRDDSFVVVDDHQTVVGMIEFLDRDGDDRARFHYQGGRATPRAD